ncbi:MAG: hypothetical protein E6K97_08670, partial [Thaumarchaeota archaeon]
MVASDGVDRRRINFLQKLELNSIFYLTLGIIFCLIIGNSISALPFFTSGPNAVVYRVWGFSIIVSFAVITQIVFVNALSKLDVHEGILYKSRIKLIKRLTFVIQYILITILVFCVFQIIFTHGYFRDLILISTWISFVFASFLLVILIIHLISWLRRNMDYTVLAYASAISIIFVNLIFTLLYITDEVRDDPAIIGSNRNAIVSFTSGPSIFSQGYNISSILSFISIWLSSGILLQHYSKKFGRLRLWIILGIALVYFLGLFQYQFLEYFSEIRIAYPSAFDTVYTFIINASTAIGGILAAVALWSVAKKVRQDKVRKYLMLAAYGTMLLIASTQAISVLSSPYPPFGIATITFMSIGSFSMLVGIYFSAVYVSQDNKLRYAISRSSKISEQLRFLKN